MKIQLSDELESALDKKCQEIGATKGAFVRAVMISCLDSEPKPLKNSRFDEFKVGKSMVFRVPSQLHESISKLAKKRDVPTQQLVREAIERAL